MAGIAREPWADPKTLYALFDEAYPQPKDGSCRSAPFVPYLAYVPDDFALALCFAGGGVYASGRFMFLSRTLPVPLCEVTPATESRHPPCHRIVPRRF
jgi:hypothetical protein